MKEIRIAVQAETNTQLINGLEKALQRFKEGAGNVPLFHSNGVYKFRLVIIEEAEIISDSFKENLTPGA